MHGKLSLASDVPKTTQARSEASMEVMGEEGFFASEIRGKGAISDDISSEYPRYC